MAAMLAYESNLTGIQVFPVQWVIIGGGILSLLLTQLALMQWRDSLHLAQTIRVGLILAAVMVSAISLLLSKLDLTGPSLVGFLIVLCEETIGRWLFYKFRI